MYIRDCKDKKFKLNNHYKYIFLLHSIIFLDTDILLTIYNVLCGKSFADYGHFF